MTFKPFNIIIRRGYICCGCGLRYTAADSVYTYEKSCICRQCYISLDMTNYKKPFFGRIYKNYVYSPFYYTDTFKKIFASFKFNGNFAFGHILGMAAADELIDIQELRDFDFITSVPLSLERMNERGYNQSDIMAKYIAAALGLKQNNVLKRTRHTGTQSTLSVKERLKNVSGAFSADLEASGKRIILFDDIYTTGTTITECSNTLKAAGAKDVCLVTAAIVYSKERNFIR